MLEAYSRETIVLAAVLGAAAALVLLLIVQSARRKSQRTSARVPATRSEPSRAAPPIWTAEPPKSYAAVAVAALPPGTLWQAKASSEERPRIDYSGEPKQVPADASYTAKAIAHAASMAGRASTIH